MNSNSRYDEFQQHQPNSGLLRFRSDHKHSSSNHKTDASTANDSSLSLRCMNSQQISSSMLVGSVEKLDHSKGFNSNLLRQSSFPSTTTAHFSNIISFQNGYGGVNDSDSELSLSMNTLKNQIGFSPRSSSSLGMGREGIGASNRDDSNGDAQYYGPKFLYDSDDQNGELGNNVHTLSHHLSLSRKSSEMFIMKELLEFPDSSVPSSVRAKRGFATHPRSIAERVRRTRISDRMRKLQELVPNIDKQTSTSDMLDLAVEHIKDLQKQCKNLSEKKAKCRCRSQK